MAIRPGAAVEQETVKVRMGGVALELPHPGSTWEGLRTDLRVFELTNTVRRQGEPETCRVGPRGHVIAVNIVRIGDPESRRRVVGREQDILGVLAGRLEVRAVRRSKRGEVCRVARRVRMTLGQNPQVVDELVAVLHAVFEEEAVTNVVVGHVVFNVQVICAMHGHAAAVGVVNRRVLDVLSLRIADQMPVDRIPGKMHVLTHAIEFDSLDKHLASVHRHNVAAKERLVCVRRSLDHDIARQHADFAAFIHVEGDLAEVHVVQFLVERDRIATDGSNGSPLGLMGIEIRGREDNHVAGPPACGVQDFNRVAACFGGLGQLRPGVRPVTVQVQGSTHHHDPAVTAVSRSTHASYIFVFDVVGEGNCRHARVGLGFRTNLQLAVHHDPLGG